MTSASASAPRRSSRRVAASNSRSASHRLPSRRMPGRVTRSSGLLPAEPRDNQADVNNPRGLPSPSANATKRARPQDQYSEASPRSRRQNTGPALDDENLLSSDSTIRSETSDQELTNRRSKRARGTTSHNTGDTMASEFSSAGTAARIFKPKEPSKPRWDSLEYSIIVQIFENLYDDDPLSRIKTHGFFLRAATVCKAFAEPVLTVLHKSPLLRSVNMTQKFADHVSDNSPHNWCNYRQKVESLVIDVGVAAHGASRVLLGTLVRSLPRLSYVKLQHWKDEKPYRMLDDNMRWAYPRELFQALGVIDGHDSDTRLKSWWWSKRMIDPHQLPDLLDVHSKPSFVGLEEIGFVNFQLPSLQAGHTDDEILSKDLRYIEQIAGSLSVLPRLNHLVMESSTIVDGRFLSLLPDTLEHLQLINCWEVTATDFSAYLATHGRQLQELTLSHNQSLSLGFLPNLAHHCPNLRVLRMNFKYFKIHEFYNDYQPYYQWLLEENEIPTWPNTLHSIELKHLREWQLPAARNFFQSIVDSAQSLSNLRRLVIKATLDIPWRERSAFRDHWAAKLGHVFLRKAEDPASSRLPTTLPPTSVDRETPQRSRRGIATPSRRSARTSRSRNTNTPSRSNGASRDLRTQTRPETYRDPDTDVDDLTSEADSHHSSPTLEDDPTSRPFVQGLCGVVDVVIDNQKPRELQYNMDDFLDANGDEDEMNDSSDQEWVSDVSSDNAYAW